MDLNSRCIGLLKEIAHEKSGVAVHVLLSKLNITKRALYYDLTKINDWLSSHNLGTVEIAEKKLTLETNDRQAVISLLDSLSSYNFSGIERRALEILYITLDTLPSSIERMQNLFDVSKNTIFSDIKTQKAMLKDYSLNMETSKRGYAITGEEIAVRKLIGRQVYYLENNHTKSILLTLIQSSMETLTGNRTINYHELVKSGVRDFERSSNTYLLLSDVDYEIIMILVACIRSLKGYSCMMEEQEQDTIKNTSAYSTVLLIMRKLYEANINLGIDESYYITLLFLGIKNFDFNSSAAESSYIWQFSMQLIQNFERIACVNFEDKQNLLSRLCLHIRPMYYRIKYGIGIKNSLFLQIKDMYATIYRYTLRALEMTGGELYELISEEEIAFLCIYMASYLNLNAAMPLRNNSQILIICGTGMAASVLLREQLIEIFGNLFQYHLVPAPETAEKHLGDYCMVISTVPMGENIDNIFYTGPILSDESKNEIISYLSRISEFAPITRKVNEVLKIVKKNADVLDEEKLFNDLARVYIHQHKFQIFQTPSLRELLKRDSSIIISRAKEFTTAVFEVAGLITKNAVYQSIYRDEILAHLQSGNGIYEIVPGVALEYCHKHSENAHVALGLVIFPYEPVRYDGHSINMLIVISAIDNTTHFSLLDEVYQMFTEKGLGAQLLKEAQNGEDVVNLINLI